MKTPTKHTFKGLIEVLEIHQLVLEKSSRNHLFIFCQIGNLNRSEGDFEAFVFFFAESKRTKLLRKKLKKTLSLGFATTRSLEKIDRILPKRPKKDQQRKAPKNNKYEAEPGKAKPHFSRGEKHIKAIKTILRKRLQETQIFLVS